MRKGQISVEMIFYLIYIPLTLLLVWGVRLIPEMLFAVNLDTHNLENKIYNERIFNEISEVDLYTKRVLRGEIKNFDEAIIKNAFTKEKSIAFKLEMMGKTAFFNQDFYEYAAPLTPIRYKLFEEKRIVDYKVPRVLTIKQVYDDKK